MELDSGDESQQMFTREMDATIGEQTERRLEDVDRALEKFRRVHTVFVTIRVRR